MSARDLLASLVSEGRAQKAQGTSADTKAQERYGAVVRDLAAGKVARDKPEERVREVLALVGKSAEDLAHDVERLQKRARLAALAHQLPALESEVKAAMLERRKVLEGVFGSSVRFDGVPSGPESDAMRALRVRVSRAQSRVLEAGRARAELLELLRQDPAATVALDRQAAAEFHVRKLTFELKNASDVAFHNAQALPRIRGRAQGAGLMEAGAEGIEAQHALAEAERALAAAREDVKRLTADLSRARDEEVAAVAAVARHMDPEAHNAPNVRITAG